MMPLEAADQAPGLLARWRALVAWLERFPLALLQLAFRIAVGIVFFKSGMLKLNSFQMAVMLFREEYKVPVLSPYYAALLATYVEVAVPLFLFAGFFTRLATLPLFGMIAVIQIFVYPDAWGEHLLWGSMLLFLLTRGAGPISLDALLMRSAPRLRGVL
jgi:putative oxidoreductase